MKFKVTEDKHYIRIVETDKPNQIKQIQISLTKKVRNYFFKQKKFKHTGWDGSFRFIDKLNRIPIGLWYKVKEICEQYEYECEIEGLDEIMDLDFDTLGFTNWALEFFKDSKFQPRDYQIESAIQILKYKRSVSEIATSAGKTFIMFMIFAYLKTHNLLDRFLIIVPNIQLVLQTNEKFEEYSNDKQLLDFKSQMIGGGEDKKIKDVDIVIGTYQTLCKLDQTFFDKVNVVCADESHGVSSKSITEVLRKCTNAYTRFGVSGTARASDETAEAYTIQSLLGPMINKISVDFLLKRQVVTPVKIDMIYMDYIEKEKKEALRELKVGKNMDGAKLLNIERDLIINNINRLNFVTDFIASLKKNTLVLFSDIKRDYGRKIFNRLKDIMENNVEIFYVDGQVDKDDRDYYRKLMNLENKQRVMVASFKTFSTGIDISNIHYIVFVESYKSEVIIKQSIGRGLRLGTDKKTIKILDLIDDFSCKGYKNYTLKHSVERENIYKEEKFKINKHHLQF